MNKGANSGSTFRFARGGQNESEPYRYLYPER